MRCVHEASLQNDNAFITLTYNQENLPFDCGLHKEHFQKFFKRLRKRYPKKKIRYFHCGEYGEKTNRPHYHACIFGLDFEDKELYKTQSGINLYVSNTLNSVWGHGFTTVGDVTFESAAYVARYVLKKITGEDADEHYQRVNPDTGEIHQVQPEYTTMSRRPGIGRDWYEKYRKEIISNDSIIVRGKEVKPPKYYDEQYEHIEEIKRERKKKAKKHAENNTLERLEIRETVKRAQIGNLKRNLD